MSTPTPPAPAPPPVQAPGAIQWYRSQRFIILCQSTVLLVLGWLIATISATPVVWLWKPIAVSVLGNILLALKDWWSPTIVAPFAALNKNNVGTPPNS